MKCNLVVSILLFAICLIFPSCKKANTPDPLSQLPAATHSGANTLGCLVNGKAFLVNVGLANWNHPLGVSFSPYDGYSWEIDGKPDSRHLTIRFNESGTNPTIPSTFNLTTDYQSRAEFLNPLDGTAINGNNEFVTNVSNTGEITISYYDGSVIAGTFNFDAANDSGVVVHITDGRFDIRQ
ncbi:MAG: DUF6252 family protein [Chitinophagaceae bacterium]